MYNIIDHNLLQVPLQRCAHTGYAEGGPRMSAMKAVNRGTLPFASHCIRLVRLDNASLQHIAA